MRALFFGFLICLGLSTTGNCASQRSILIASTTSTEQSGLFSYLLPIFTKASGIRASVVAVGTGQALDIGRRGDADLVLVHDRIAEERFVAEGFGIERIEVMANDFVLVGPQSDPARISGLKDVVKAFQHATGSGSTFVSRGDKSGTHTAERRFWKAAGLEPSGKAWYLETGSGMGPSLNVAAAKDAYILTDRGTWLNFKNRGNLTVLLEGDARLLNPYSVILVNPAKHPHVRFPEAKRFANWLTSADGQRAIASFLIDGQQVFFGSAKPQ